MFARIAATWSNRRSAARSKLFMLVRCRSVHEQDAMWATDLSVGGMQCQSKKVRFPGTYLDLQFTLPNTAQPLRVGAQVVTVEQGDKGMLALGLRFCALPMPAQQVIGRFLESREQLWAGAAIRQSPRQSAHLCAVAQLEQPFAKLLADSYARIAQTPTQMHHLDDYRGANAPVKKASPRRQAQTKVLRAASGVWRSVSGVFRLRAA